MDGVILTPLKQIYHPKGDVYHAMKKSDSGFSGFGEAYFSTIYQNDIKGWKKHNRMVLNLVVPVGRVKFVMFDDRNSSVTKGNFFEVELSENNYCRLTVPKGVWLAFMGMGKDINLLLNIASIEHDPLEAQTENINCFNYDWSQS